MTGAQFIATTLERYGVTHIFFVPTILSKTLFHLEERTSIARILTHGEKAAAYMADGYARASGRVGVCCSQMVGAANLAAGLRDAYLACAPVLAVTGGPYPGSPGRNMYQENDDFRMLQLVSKWSMRVEVGDRLAPAIRSAFQAATSGKPGPTHLELAGHFGELIEEASVTAEAVESEFCRAPAFRPCADDESIAVAAQLLARAERPIIVAGGGVRTSGAEQELRMLAESMNVPVVTSLNAKEVIPGDHPLNAGVVGLYSRESANRAVLDSDLVFFVGSKTGSQVTHSWQIPPPGRAVIQLDIDAGELGRNYVTRASLLGDAKMTLGRLCALADLSTAPRRAPWTQQVSAYVAQWREKFDAAMQSLAEPIRPERMCRVLNDVLPDDALVVADTGHAGMWTAAMLDLREGHGFIRAAGSLGWGLPAAIGAKFAAPDRPVVLFTGDGGAYYHLSELETAARWRVPVVVIVNNNRSLNQEVEVYEPAYGGRLHGRHHELWHFDDIDFSRVAETLGVRGIRITRPSDIAAALETAFAHEGPVVVDAVTDIEAMAPLAFVRDELTTEAVA